ncbi:HD domain-containing phosphohydrolase [Pelomonas sp. SE-A7]|uniref:HD-GYP domain-containing protein n=1 Tax=Pelomonas sp. SE-A7 TaxID=3054953 RepID=UPI00259CF3C7|nr:HD domain-containing phosphohydrolase [Pelomonas sp. SE-A7]MDM4767868.1 HD domain-containing phosphohydrolase [Pelomonas sp. SE-A7]
MSASGSTGVESVNPHFFNHVVATAATRQVQTSEDIYSAQGIKLLAKGAAIDESTRDRLLAHKLSKPLEDCVQVIDGVVPELFGPLAEKLQDEHPLLKTLCSHQRAQPVSATLSTLRLSMQVQSLLTVYAGYQGDRLSHSVGVAMLTLALARRLLPDQIDRHRQLALAGLLHDVGELYIDPSYLERGRDLEPEQWRHIVSHPVIGHRVLLALPGAGAAVAEAVLNHHERLDGFGYPRGLVEDQVPLDGQILAVSEWLMALIESGGGALARASVASKLIPGEFSPSLLEAINAAARNSGEMDAWLQSLQPLASMQPQFQRVTATLERFETLRAWLDRQIADSGPALREVLQQGLRRMLRIQASFYSSGLNSLRPDDLQREQELGDDPELKQELAALIGEFGWRLRELEREALLRAGLLTDSELQVVKAWVQRLRGETREGDLAQAA